MSQGDRISQGGKGTNYPYQSKALKGLQKSIDELEAINVNLIPVAGLATEVTLDLVRLLLVALESKDFATQTTLTTVDTKLASLARTPNIIRSSAAGSIAVICYSFSVANVGLADGVILGAAILAGETLSFDAGALNNFYTAGSVTYDGTGTELVIVYNS